MSNVTKGMVIQGLVESKESKGFLIDLGFKDQAKGFVKLSDGESLKTGQAISIIVRSVMKKAKVIKSEILTKSNSDECVQ